MSDYNTLLNALYAINLHSGMKLGLSKSFALSGALEKPEHQFRTIHVAGTNGKGSVAAKIAKGLQADGKKVGLYTSPHISCFRERITINGQMIDEESFVTHLTRLFSLNLSATFFEYATFLAFLYFAEQKVDYAVIETGIGGRLDATNLIHPELSIITSISLDHTEILGGTLDEIAYEKAGIIKYGVPLIIGPKADYAIIRTFARVQQSSLYPITGTFASFDEENKAIARKALELLEATREGITQGIAMRPPCRIEKLGTVTLDVAHNPDGLKELFKTFGNQKQRIIFGLSKTKDIEGCLAILKEHGSHFYPVEAPNGRGIPAEELFELMLKTGFSKDAITICSSIEESVQTAVATDEPTLVCGTFFIMASARKALGIVEPTDPYDTNEKALKSSLV